MKFFFVACKQTLWSVDVKESKVTMHPWLSSEGPMRSLGTIFVVLSFVLIPVMSAFADEAIFEDEDGSSRSAKVAECEESHSKMMALLDEGPAKLTSGPFDIAFHTRIQTWGGWVGDDSYLDQGDHMQQYGFRLRRARFGIDGHLFKSVTYALELDVFDQERTGGPLYEAWIDVTPTRFFGIKAGYQRFAFMKTDMMSSSGTALLDRAIGVYAMSPGSAMGVAVTTEPWKDHLWISLGVFNGLQREDSFFKGYEGIGVSLGNKFERLSYVGRFDLEPLERMGSGVPDFQDKWEFKAPRLGFGAGAFYSDGLTAEMYGVSGYVHLKAYGMHLLAETAWDHGNPQAVPTTTSTLSDERDRLIAHGEIGYTVPKMGFGFAIRAEYIDDNMDMDNERDQVVVAAALSHYLYGHYLKTVIEYQKRIELNGIEMDNDSVVVGLQLMF